MNFSLSIPYFFCFYFSLWSIQGLFGAVWEDDVNIPSRTLDSRANSIGLTPPRSCGTCPRAPHTTACLSACRSELSSLHNPTPPLHSPPHSHSPSSPVRSSSLTHRTSSIQQRTARTLSPGECVCVCGGHRATCPQRGDGEEEEGAPGTRRWRQAGPWLLDRSDRCGSPVGFCCRRLVSSALGLKVRWTPIFFSPPLIVQLYCCCCWKRPEKRTRKSVVANKVKHNIKNCSKNVCFYKSGHIAKLRPVIAQCLTHTKWDLIRQYVKICV